MERLVEFCDLCHSDGALRLASSEYLTSNHERVVICKSCGSIVKSAGLEIVPLDLPDLFLEDIKEGLEFDEELTLDKGE